MSFLPDVKTFSQQSLRKVDTKLVTSAGIKCIEKRSENGKFHLSDTGERCPGFCVDDKPDLQVVVVRPWLLLSAQDVAAELSLLRQHNVTHILNLAYLADNHFEDEFKYLKIEILDLPETCITSYFSECFDFIDEAKSCQGVALVHCNAGISRSVSVILAYLLATENVPLEESLLKLRQLRPAANPNVGFMQQLKQYEKKVLK